MTKTNAIFAELTEKIELFNPHEMANVHTAVLNG